jgi:hypothetical protein
MKKQTTVEWLVEQTPVEWLVDQLKGVYESDYLNKLIEQAKEMEKEQNQLLWAKGWNDGHLSTLQENTETFKSE